MIFQELIIGNKYEKFNVKLWDDRLQKKLSNQMFLINDISRANNRLRNMPFKKTLFFFLDQGHMNGEIVKLRLISKPPWVFLARVAAHPLNISVT